jgi:hypothetical protein
MRVLVACEFSGIVRDAFGLRGHDALSCDLLPTERPGPHAQHDVRELLGEPWDLIVAHPPCTYLCNSGVRWLHTEPGRWGQMLEAVAFFHQLLAANAPRICVENPIPHRHADLPRYTQIIHPWEFGHRESKATCLWLKGLPPLMPTALMCKREQRLHRLPPNADRWRDRSRTYQGIADAMAAQWGYSHGA